MPDPGQMWAQQLMSPTIPLRRPTPRPTPGPLVLPGQAPRPSVSPASGWAVLDPWARGAPGVMPPPRGGRRYLPPQDTGPKTILDYLSPEEYGRGLRIEAGLEPRAQAPPSIVDLANLALSTRAAADRREQDRRNWEYKQEQDRIAWERQGQQLDEMMRQFGITTGATADWRQGQLGMQQAQLGQQYAQMQQTGQYQQGTLAQRWAEMEMQRQQQAAQLAQRRREMGASIGQGIAGLQAQTWAQGMPYALPSGTMFAPGMGPRGPVSEMARRAGVSYTPQRVAKANPPTRAEMEDWIRSAIERFGG